MSTRTLIEMFKVLRRRIPGHMLPWLGFVPLCLLLPESYELMLFIGLVMT